MDRPGGKAQSAAGRAISESPRNERLAQFEALPASRAPLPAAGNRQSGRAQAVRALIPAGNGLTWNQVRIEVHASKMILLTAPGQERGPVINSIVCYMVDFAPIRPFS